MELSKLLNTAFPGSVGSTLLSKYCGKFISFDKQHYNPRQHYVFLRKLYSNE